MIKVAVFGIVASLIAMKIKTIRPEIAILIAVISSILLAMYGLKHEYLYLRIPCYNRNTFSVNLT